MKKQLFAAAFLFALLSSIPADASEISVLLKQKITQSSIKGNGIVFTDARGANSKAQSGTFKISRSKDAVTIGNAAYQLPVIVKSSYGRITVDGVAYKGIMLIEKAESGFNIANKIDIEEYLKGVLKSEMSPKWPIEALKAQAVLARTYVFVGKRHGEHDVCATTHCQVYGGVADESPNIVQAINETKGQLLTYGASAARVFYFSDSGGMTTDSSTVWGAAIPYLTYKADPVPNDSPNKRWEASLTMAEIGSRLDEAGYGVGTLSSLRPVKRDKSGRIEQIEVSGSAGTRIMKGNDFRMAVGPRVVKSTLFEFNARSATPAKNIQIPTPAPIPAPKQATTPVQPNQPQEPKVPGTPQSDIDKLYWMANHKIFSTKDFISMIGDSANYSQYIAEGLKRMTQLLAKDKNSFGQEREIAEELIRLGAESEERLIRFEPESGEPEPIMPIALSASLTPPPAEEKPALQGAVTLSMERAAGQTVNFYGSGYGHGVGLPQWTAKALAEAGWDYKQMLEYYFHGTTLETR